MCCGGFPSDAEVLTEEYEAEPNTCCERRWRGEGGGECSAAARNVDLVKLSDWHEAKHYVDMRPLDHFDEGYLRRHAAAAIRIAAFTAEQVRENNLDADLMRRFELRLGNCEAALGGSLRVRSQQRSRRRGRGL